MRDWRLVFPGSCQGPWRTAGRVKDRAEPGRRGGAGGVLEATGREPDDVAAGNRSRVRLLGVWLSSGSVPMTG